jgi:hypothetical protein
MKEVLDGLEQVMIHHLKRYSHTSAAWQMLGTRDRIDFIKRMRHDMEKILTFEAAQEPDLTISEGFITAESNAHETAIANSVASLKTNTGEESKTSKVEAPAKSPAKTATKTTSGGKGKN